MLRKFRAVVSSNCQYMFLVWQQHCDNSFANGAFIDADAVFYREVLTNNPFPVLERMAAMLVQVSALVFVLTDVLVYAFD